MVLSRSVSSFIARLAVLTLVLAPGFAYAETSQERVHKHSHHVMPFEMSATIHVFQMTETGGDQRVLARNPDDAEQISLIRQHLKHEADKFSRGDYSDPSRLHGADMPGLAELQASPSEVAVSYSELPAGAQLSFRTEDRGLLTAIHRWFGAQLSDHGADARAE
jgi:hypothetical protein